MVLMRGITCGNLPRAMSLLSGLLSSCNSPAKETSSPGQLHVLWCQPHNLTTITIYYVTLFIYLFIHVHSFIVHSCIHSLIHSFIHSFICLFVYLFIYLFVYLFVHLIICLFTCLFVICYYCFREQYGIPVLVKLLEAMPFDGVTAAAADALRALAMSNEANKTAIREAWAVPLLVKLLGAEVRICFPRCSSVCSSYLHQCVYKSIKVMNLC